MMDSSTFKRFTASIENILENLEDMDFTAFGNASEIFKMLSPIRNARKTKKIVYLYFQTSFLVDVIACDTCKGMLHLYGFHLEWWPLPFQFHLLLQEEDPPSSSLQNPKGA